MDLYDRLNDLRLRLNGNRARFPDQVMEEMLERYIYFRTNSDKGKDCSYAKKSRALFDSQDKVWVLREIRDIVDGLDKQIPNWREQIKETTDAEGS